MGKAVVKRQDEHVCFNNVQQIVNCNWDIQKRPLLPVSALFKGLVPKSYRSKGIGICNIFCSTSYENFLLSLPVLKKAWFLLDWTFLQDFSFIKIYKIFLLNSYMASNVHNPCPLRSMYKQHFFYIWGGNSR